MSDPYTVRLQLRWGDSDELGHINNVLYLEYAQEARLRFFRELGGALGAELGAVVVRSLQVSFDRSLHYSVEGIDVQVWVTKVGTSSFTLRHRIRDPQGTVYSTVDAVVVSVDATMEKSEPLTAGVREALLGQVRDDA